MFAFRDYHTWIFTEKIVKMVFYHAKQRKDFIWIAEGNEALQGYALRLLGLNFSESYVSDLIYYPECGFENESVYDVNLTYNEYLGV